MQRLVAIAFLGLAAPVAADCPAVPDHEPEMSRLLGHLAAAPDPVMANRFSEQLWQLWTTAPDARAQDLLDRGMARRLSGDLDGAAALFDRLVEYCPDYAEGWNQRAFARFLQRDFAASLADLDAALARTPDHVGALSGRALALIGLGRDAEAQAALREALDRNPWLPERALLVAPPGTDL
ncbi:tetratricopeptide repeat protein [Limimaricola pyoseonensis]|uniref:TPR repeat-containing protein n=1 Tax=Limimaricola pyoseonensis TaxID=521013 RepID=A0A1G7CV89_9RHOB|nr:hypothetical protein [Limimaricola pyoseonensis]SDE42546.1 TPR repeat-containing protein [Limimaricola pyoseonensis]